MFGVVHPSPNESSCDYLHKKQETACHFSNVLRTKPEVLNSFLCFGSVFHCQIYNYVLHNYSEATPPAQISVLVACNAPKRVHCFWYRKEYIMSTLGKQTSKWHFKANNFIHTERQLYKSATTSHD